MDADLLDRGFAGADGGLGAFDGGLVGRYRLRHGVGVGAQLLGLVAGDHAALRQFGVALGLRFGVARLRRVARQVGLRLTQSGAVARRIGQRLVETWLRAAAVDFEEDLALLDEVAFTEMDGVSSPPTCAFTVIVE